MADNNYIVSHKVFDKNGSSEYQEIRESHTSSSSDYDSWDSGDTDWDSDW